MQAEPTGRLLRFPCPPLTQAPSFFDFLFPTMSSFYVFKSCPGREALIPLEQHVAWSLFALVKKVRSQPWQLHNVHGNGPLPLDSSGRMEHAKLRMAEYQQELTFVLIAFSFKFTWVKEVKVLLLERAQITCILRGDLVV